MAQPKVQKRPPAISRPPGTLIVTIITATDTATHSSASAVNIKPTRKFFSIICCGNVAETIATGIAEAYTITRD